MKKLGRPRKNPTLYCKHQELAEFYETQKKLADAVGCSQGLVCCWLSGKTEIASHFAMKIEIITNGKFKAIDLCPRLAEIEKLKTPSGN